MGKTVKHKTRQIIDTRRRHFLINVLVAVKRTIYQKISCLKSIIENVLKSLIINIHFLYEHIVYKNIKFKFAKISE